MGLVTLLQSATRVALAALAAAVLVAAAPTLAEPKLDQINRTASPVRIDRLRCVQFSFRGRECDVGYSRFGADIEHADDIFVSASFIAPDDHCLLRIQL